MKVKPFQLISILFAGQLFAQPATRPVVLTWGAAPAGAVTSITVSRAATAAGPSVQLSTLPGTATTYTDTTAVIGQTYTYQVLETGTPCTPTTPVTTACGQVGGSVTTTVPPAPNLAFSLSVSIQ